MQISYFGDGTVSSDNKIWVVALVVVSLGRMENTIGNEMKELEAKVFMGHPYALLKSPSITEILVINTLSSLYFFLINITLGNVHWKNCI